MDGRYATVAEVRLALRAPANASATSWAAGDFDPVLSRHLLAAEEWIDNHCGQRFTAAGDDPTGMALRVAGDDRIILTGPAATNEATVVVAGTTVTGWRWLLDDTYRGGVARHIELPVRAMVSPHRTRRPATVTARWGWPAVPSGIKTVAIDLAAHQFMMEEQISNTAGMPSMGYVSPVPRNLRLMLTQYRHPNVL